MRRTDRDLSSNDRVISDADRYVAADDGLPVSRLLFLYLWPFAFFRNADRGDRLARAAAYRHNREMRIHLPAYLRRWVVLSTLLYGLICAGESLAAHPLSLADPFAVLTVASTVGLASAVSVVVMTVYVYLYLGHNDR
jgi:hypothetical protein